MQFWLMLIKIGEVRVEEFEITEDSEDASQRLLEKESLPVASRTQEEQLKLTACLKEITQLSLPFITIRMIELGAILASQAMLARINPSLLAAIGLASPIQTTITGTSLTALVSSSVLMSRAIKEGKYNDVGIIYRHSMIYAALVALPGVSMALLSPYILIGLGQDEVLAYQAGSYLRTYSLSILPMLFQNINQQVFLADKKPWLVIPMSVIYASLSNALVYLFVSNSIGFSLGMVGLGLGGALASLVNFSIWTSYLKFQSLSVKGRYHRYHLFEKSISDQWLVILQSLAKLGLPPAFHFFLELLSVDFVSIMLGWMGKQQLIAQQITAPYIHMITAPIAAMSNSLAVLVASHSPINAKHIGYLGILMGIVLPAILLSIALLLHRQLFSVFINVDDPAHDHIIDIARWFLLLSGISACFSTNRYMSEGSLRGLMDTVVPMFAAIISMCLIAPPASYILGFTTELGAPGIYLARAITMSGCAAFLVDRWRKKINTHIELDGKHEVVEGTFSQTSREAYRMCVTKTSDIWKKVHKTLSPQDHGQVLRQNTP